MNYKAIFISDVHLGTRFSKANELLDFLKKNSFDELYLVGDIIDGWAMRRKLIWKQAHSDVIQKILKAARKGKKVYFITGNHDEFLRPFIPLLLGDNLEVSNEAVYMTPSGKRFLVTHGDFFDSITMTKKWLALLGDKGYDMLLHANLALDFVRRKLGIKRYWSLSKYVKDNIKSSVSFITDFEGVLVAHANRKGFDGVVCGHIHKASMQTIDEVHYYNCGDWVESCTAIAHTHDDEFVMIDWLQEANTL